MDDPTAYGTFTRAWDYEDYNQFLFITGDKEHWLVATKEAVRILTIFVANTFFFLQNIEQ